MSIEKVTPNYLKHAEFPQPFTTILNETIDSIPTDSAIGIYVYLARKPPDWEIQEKDIMTRFNRGRDHVRKCLAILKEIGLLKKQAIRDEKGHISRWETILYRRVPENISCDNQEETLPSAASNHITENPSSGQDIHITENPTCGVNHILGKPTHTNNIYIQKKEIITNNILTTFVDSKESPKRSTKDYRDDELFMAFYSQYPNKQKPHVAYQAFLKHKPTDEFVNMLIDDINQRSTKNWAGRDKSKIPHPSTYLNSREWEGELYSIQLERGSSKIKRKSFSEIAKWDIGG